MPRDYAIAATVTVAIWASCALAPRDVRRALLDGLRCMRRYPDLWRIPAVFGLGYAIFQLLAAAIFHWRLQDLGEWLMQFSWQPRPELAPLLFGSLSAAAERAASIFTIFTATFPLSALFAALLFFNFRGMLSEMTRAFRRRLGPWRGLGIGALLLLTALCAIARPAAYLLLPELIEHVDITIILAVNFLSYIFELLLGIFFLTYLMLMAYAWMRGLSFTRPRLFHVAMRRTGFVLKWSLPLAILTALLVLLPPYLGLLISPDGDFAWLSKWIGVPAITALALFYCPVQAILVFHNESLRQALRDSSRLLRTRWAAIFPFLLTVFVTFFLLVNCADYLIMRLGAESALALTAGVFVAWIEALLAGWLIASWVCLYKNLSTGRKEIPF